MNLKDVISTVIKSSYGFCLESATDVQKVIKACAKGDTTIAYSNFNDNLSVFIFDGDIEPLEVAIGKSRTYGEDNLYDLLDAMRSDGVIDEDQMSDLFAYIDKISDRGCVSFEVTLIKPDCYVLNGIQVMSSGLNAMNEWLSDCITDSIARGYIGMPSTSVITKFAKG